MFSTVTLKFTNKILRQRQFLRTFCIFSATKNVRNQLCAPFPFQFIPTKTSIPQQSMQFRIKHTKNGNLKNSTKLKFLSIRKLWKDIFGKYLLITNIVGSGILMVFGDVMAQEIEYRRGIPNSQRYDWQRMGRMFIVGALQGPLHHFVYNWMDKIMPVANFKNIVKKILIDELLMSPACIFIFFYSACFLERKTFKETNHELKEKFLFIYFIDWLLWPGAQYINFRYLETKYRVTFVNVCTALYNIFMSYVKHDYNVKL